MSQQRLPLSAEFKREAAALVRIEATTLSRPVVRLRLSPTILSTVEKYALEIELYVLNGGSRLRFRVAARQKGVLSGQYAGTLSAPCPDSLSNTTALKNLLRKKWPIQTGYVAGFLSTLVSLRKQEFLVALEAHRENFAFCLYQVLLLNRRSQLTP